MTAIPKYHTQDVHYTSGHNARAQRIMRNAQTSCMIFENDYHAVRRVGALMTDETAQAWRELNEAIAAGKVKIINEP